MRLQGGGKIIVTTSMMGRISMPFLSFYSSSKWALEGLLENMRYELKGTNVKLAALAPGIIRTRFFKDETKSKDFGDNFYKSKFEGALNNINNGSEKGASPEMVAQKVWKIANSDGNKFRYIVDFMAYFLIYHRLLTPLNFNQYIISKIVK